MTTKLERSPKNPKVPTMPAEARALAQKLHEIIDASNEQSPIAYATLSRLCVLWTPEALAGDSMEGGQRSIVVNDLVRLMAQLFPQGEGLPIDEGSDASP